MLMRGIFYGFGAGLMLDPTAVGKTTGRKSSRIDLMDRT